MYSVVLMAALTVGTSAPTFGDHGYSGGWGSKHGHHGYGGAWISCYGCYGGYSGACYGGYDGCGGGGKYGHHGYGAGWASCYGGSSGACYGCYGGGGCYGSSGGYGNGCSGAACYGCCGEVVVGSAAMTPAQMSTPAAPPGNTVPEQIPPPKKAKTTALDQAARLIVELPADAKLYVDDQLTKATSERRVFTLLQLEPGKTYYYILRAETVRDGQAQSETKAVFFHLGDVVQTSFRDLGTLAVSQTQPDGGQ
jgi:uncharacterized protein (TIGR03000 family)